MKVKTAIDICKSIHAPNISADDKLEAVQIVLESDYGYCNLSKPVMFEVIRFLKGVIDNDL